MTHPTSKPNWGNREPLSYRSLRKSHPEDIDLGYIYSQGFTAPCPAPTPPPSPKPTPPPSAPAPQPAPQPVVRPLTFLPPEPPTPKPRIPGWLIAGVIPFVFFACNRGFKTALIHQANDQACIERGYKDWAKGGDSSKPGRLRYKGGFCY